MKLNLKEIYDFKNIHKFVVYGIEQCTNCIHNDNYTNSNYVAPMKLLPIPAYSYECVHVDLCGPFPESKWGNKYVIIAACRLTMFVELGALRHV